MNSNRAKIIAAMIESLASGIRIARAHSLEQTALLLEMAKLDLQTELHGISDEELRTFCRTIEAASEAHVAEESGGEKQPNNDNWWSPSREAEVAEGLKYHDRNRVRTAARRSKTAVAEAREPLRSKAGARQGVVGNAHAEKGNSVANVTVAKHEDAEASLIEISKLLH